LKEEEEKQLNEIRERFSKATNKIEDKIEVNWDKIKHIETMQTELNHAFKMNSSVSFIQASESANSISKESNLLIPSGTEDIYVCDLSNNRIQVFDSEGNLLRNFGTKGCGNGQFEGP
jgi:DNA-binding beta-propeller fold protein YncE